MCLWRLSASCLFLLIAVSASPAWAIVVSDDPNDPNHIVVSGSPYDGVGYLSLAGGTNAVLIDPWHVLTAKHVAGSITGGTFRLGYPGAYTYYTLQEAFLSPDSDLAVIRLGDSTGMAGYGLYDPGISGSESGKTGILVGYGKSGTGLTGVDADTYPQGTKRVGSNALVIDGDSPNYLLYDFDGPWPQYGNGPLGGRTLGANKEVMIADKDSGGPTFIDVGGGVLKIAGIHSGIADFNNNGLGDGIMSNFGDIGFDVQVSVYATWINQKMNQQQGDYNNNGSLDAGDIDLLSARIRSQSPDMWYDLSGDSVLSLLDTNELVLNMLGTFYGDADLSGVVDSNDFQALSSNWLGTGAGWAQGDFNGDAVVNSDDFDLLSNNWMAGSSQLAGQAAMPSLDALFAPTPVPEPATIWLLCAAAVTVLRRAGKHRRR